MLLQNKQVAIIGGGPGGLTLARLLQVEGVHVKVYERDPGKNARVQGSPLDLHETSGLAAIRKAGLLDIFRANYMDGADRTTITNPNAEILFSDHEQPGEQTFGDEHFRPEIDRGVLRRILLESLHEDTVIWDSHFISMKPTANGWTLQFKNGHQAFADLVIAADGANSKLRPYVTGIKPFYTGITMLEGHVADAAKNIPGMTAILRGGKIMAFGKNQDILMGQKADGEVGFYASFRTHESWAKTNGLDYNSNESVLEWFRKEYPEWGSQWHELFANATDAFIPRPIYCMPYDQEWEPLPNLTLLGDAAHLMPPFAGEGVNMAMLDALELSEQLLTEANNTLVEAIGIYEKQMRRRASVVAKESTDNGERMHSENALESMLDFFQGK
ncbi:MAG: FAD-dependent monooxygenase [Chitinophagaceae bacterium]|nr:MAG: FAD-dependent monooxygenase [Chitinophagaceae bacterium]